MEVWFSMIFVFDFECNSFLDSKGIITPMLQPPTLQVDENVVKHSSRGMGWWDLFHMFFLFPKAGSKRKVVTQTEERMAVCYHWEQPAYLRLVLGRPLFCYHWPGFPRFLKRFAEVTTASLQMSRDLGLEGRAREVDSKQLWGFFKTRKIPDKGKVKMQKSQKKTKQKKSFQAWNC